MIGATYVVPRLGKDVPVASGCTSIVSVPEEILAFLNAVPGARVVGGPVPGWLAEVSKQMAEYNGAELHHAEWRITDEPEDVREWVADEPTAAEAVAALEVHKALAVGELYFA